VRVKILVPIKVLEDQELQKDRLRIFGYQEKKEL
jgi:hypothetical protein